MFVVNFENGINIKKVLMAVVSMRRRRICEK